MASAFDFSGKVALVTGGGSGIGRATCQLLARDGARVVVTDINLKGAQETLKLMPGTGHHLAMHLDVTQRDEVERVIKTAQEEFGVLPSLLVNAAAVCKFSTFLDVDTDLLNATINVNLQGTFIVSQVFTKALLDKKQNTEAETGAVVNISSMAGKTGMKGATHYAASKGGVVALTKSCAADLSSKGIRVNCVLPGLVDTPMFQCLPKELTSSILNKTPLGRVGRPEEVAEMIVFLLSGRSSYATGSCVEVSGGTGM